MTENGVDLILKAINDMQDNINTETDKKLEKFVSHVQLKDLEDLIAAINRKVGHNEGLLKDLGTKHDHAEGMIEGNRKRIARLVAELDAMKKGTSLPPMAVAEIADTAVISSDDMVDSEALDKLQKMIQRVEGNMIRRIATVETAISRVDNIEGDMAVMKFDIKKALMPRDPEVTKEDFDRW